MSSKRPTTVGLSPYIIVKLMWRTVVYESGGFDKISTIEGTDFNTYSTRGRDAWQALRDHYHQVGSARTSELLADFNRPKQPHESRSTFVTRIINKRLEIKQTWTNVSTTRSRQVTHDGRSSRRIPDSDIIPQSRRL